MKTHEKKYHNATFYRKMGISITILIRELGEGFGETVEIKRKFKTVCFSENLYDENEIINAVKKACGNEDVKTIGDARTVMEKFCRKRNIARHVEANRRLKNKTDNKRKKIVRTSDKITRE